MFQYLGPFLILKDIPHAVTLDFSRKQRYYKYVPYLNFTGLIAHETRMLLFTSPLFHT